jgi:hypothetical protein
MRALFLLLLISGCGEAMLVNDRGEKRYCYRTGINVMERYEFSRCVNELGTAGFKRAN